MSWLRPLRPMVEHGPNLIPNPPTAPEPAPAVSLPPTAPRPEITSRPYHQHGRHSKDRGGLATTVVTKSDGVRIAYRIRTKMIDGEEVTKTLAMHAIKTSESHKDTEVVNAGGGFSLSGLNGVVVAILVVWSLFGSMVMLF